MKMRTWVVLLVAVAVAVGACSSAGGGRSSSAPTPIESVAAIAGTWTGTLDFGAGEQPCTLTIEPGGRAVIVGRTLTANGSVAVQGGKGSYSFPGRSDGALTLYQDAGKRQLSLKGQGGVFDVWVTPK